MRFTFSLIITLLIFMSSLYAQPTITREEAQDSLYFLQGLHARTTDTLMKGKLVAYPSYNRFVAFEKGNTLGQDSLMIILQDLREIRPRVKKEIDGHPKLQVVTKKIATITHIVHWEYAESLAAKAAYEAIHFPNITFHTQKLVMFWEIYREDLRQMEPQDGVSRGGTPANQAYLFGSDPLANHGQGNGIGYKLFRDCNKYLDSLASICEACPETLLESFRLSPKNATQSWVIYTFSGDLSQNLVVLDAIQEQMMKAKNAVIRELTK